MSRNTFRFKTITVSLLIPIPCPVPPFKRLATHPLFCFHGRHYSLTIGQPVCRLAHLLHKNKISMALHQYPSICPAAYLACVVGLYRHPWSAITILLCRLLLDVQPRCVWLNIQSSNSSSNYHNHRTPKG